MSNFVMRREVACKKARVMVVTEETAFASYAFGDGATTITNERIVALAKAMADDREPGCAFAERVLGETAATEGAYPTSFFCPGGIFDARRVAYVKAYAKKKKALVVKNATGADLMIVARSPFTDRDVVVTRWPDGSVAAFVEGTLVGFDDEIPEPEEGFATVPVAHWGHGPAASGGGRGAASRLAGVEAARVKTARISDMKFAYRVTGAPLSEISHDFDLVGTADFNVLSYDGKLWSPFFGKKGSPMTVDKWSKKHGRALFDVYDRLAKLGPDGPDPDAANAKAAKMIESLLFVVLDDGKTTIAMKEAETPTYGFEFGSAPRLTWENGVWDGIRGPFAGGSKIECMPAAGAKGLLLEKARAAGAPKEWIRRAEPLAEVEALDPDTGAPMAAQPKLGEIAPGVVMPTSAANDPEVKAAIAKWIASGSVPFAWATTLTGVERRWIDAGVPAKETIDAIFDPAKCLILPHGGGFLLAAISSGGE